MGFERIKKIGSGTFGAVWLGKRESDGKEFALKTLPLGEMAERPDEPGEIRILRDLDSPYILKLHDSFTEKDCLCLVLEYC